MSSNIYRDIAKINLCMPELGIAESVLRDFSDAINPLSTVVSKNFESIIPQLSICSRVMQSFNQSIFSQIKEADMALKSVSNPIIFQINALKDAMQSLSVLPQINMFEVTMKSITEALQPLRSIDFDTINSFNSVIKNINQSIMLNSHAYNLAIENIHQSISPVTDLMRLQIEILNNEVANLAPSNIIHNPDGTIIAEDQKISLENLKNIINSCIEDSGVATKKDIAEGLNNLIQQIPKKDGIIKTILISLIAGLLIAFCMQFLNPMINDVQSKAFRAYNKIIIKQIKRNASSISPNAIIQNFRIVNAEVLNVRKYSYNKSEIVGKLYFGQLVRIINKKRNWTLIEYISDDGDVCIRGWVFTRYISKLT